MKLVVHLQPISDGGYVARCAIPTGWVEIEAPTRELALERVQERARAALERGEVVEVDVPLANEPHPLLAFAGWLKDHPDAAAVEENIREYRRRLDEELP